MKVQQLSNLTKSNATNFFEMKKVT